jgi:hypothetical protein
VTTLAALAPLAPRTSPREVTQARWVFALLAAQFIAPAISYLVQPTVALGTLDAVNRLLGGGAYVAHESTGHLWHMLAVGNVMTLGFLCALLALDLGRFGAALPGLVFLKSFSALFSLGQGLTGGPPLFLAVFALDGLTSVAMVVFGVRGLRALRRERGLVVPPIGLSLLLLDADAVARGLARVERARLVPTVPTLAQAGQGVLRMWKRLLFRSDTVGTSDRPVRPNWRARLLHWRVARFPFLLWEQAVAPFDFSGLISSPERICRHLLGAHHQPAQLLYDLELLSLVPGALETLEAAATEAARGDTPRTRWLQDLCVHEGYHQSLLEAVQRFRRGESLVTRAQAADPDVSFKAWLSWCAEQPEGRTRSSGETSTSAVSPQALS